MYARPAPFATLAVLALVGLVSEARADDPAPAPASPKRTAPARIKERAAATAPAALPNPAQPTATLDPVATKADAESRLKALELVPDKELTGVQKTTRDLLSERLRWVDNWQKSRAAYEAASKPKPTPEDEASRRKDDLERDRVRLDQAAKLPDALLPATFRLAPAQVDAAKLAEMREAIEAAKVAQNDRLAELEKARSEPAERTARLNALRAERDKIQARIATIPARRTERVSALTAATDDDARTIARERLTNFAWESSVENERLLEAEATIALETRRAASSEVALQARQASAELARQTVAALTGCYTVFAERQKLEINHARDEEKARARATVDPVEKYLARRRADLLALQGQILDDNKALSASRSPEEQRTLADHAKSDFENLKQAVKDNRAGGLIALRLNNDFRRIGYERSTLIRNELAESTAANTLYENALTEAEIASFNDARDDRFECEAFLETLPQARRPAAKVAIDEIEAKHKALLNDHRGVLGKLLARAEETHEQVARRLAILDEQYAFVRTNIFWVRDSEPIGATTLPQARRDVVRLARTMVRLAAEPLDPAAWSPVSAEFALGSAGVLVLPLVIWRVRKRLDAIEV